MSKIIENAPEVLSPYQEIYGSAVKHIERDGWCTSWNVKRDLKNKYGTQKIGYELKKAVSKGLLTSYVGRYRSVVYRIPES